MTKSINPHYRYLYILQQILCMSHPHFKLMTYNIYTSLLKMSCPKDLRLLEPKIYCLLLLFLISGYHMFLLSMLGLLTGWFEDYTCADTFDFFTNLVMSVILIPFCRYFCQKITRNISWQFLVIFYIILY